MRQGWDSNVPLTNSPVVSNSSEPWGKSFEKFSDSLLFPILSYTEMTYLWVLLPPPNSQLLQDRACTFSSSYPRAQQSTCAHIQIHPIPIGTVSYLGVMLLASITGNPIYHKYGNSVEWWDARVIELESTQIHSLASLKQRHHSGSLQSFGPIGLCSKKCFLRDHLPKVIQGTLQSLCRQEDRGLKRLTCSGLRPESVSCPELRPGSLDFLSRASSKPQDSQKDLCYFFVFSFFKEWSIKSFFNASTACYKDICHKKKKASF